MRFEGDEGKKELEEETNENWLPIDLEGHIHPKCQYCTTLRLNISKNAYITRQTY